MRFASRLEEAELLLYDGAMGTRLQQEGLRPGQCPEKWNLLREDKVKGVHRAYAAAGADILETNSFGGNRARLVHYQVAEQLAQINRRAVELAREAGGGEIMVAAAVGPTGRILVPAGDLTAEEGVEIFAEQAEALLAGEPDLFLVETMSDLAEARAAVQGIKRVSDLPVIAQLTFTEHGRTPFGNTPEQVVRELEEEGVAALGANCSLGPQDLIPVVEAMAVATTLPISVQPNAGQPSLDAQGEAVYSLGPQEFARWALRLRDAGARLLGGCCGTTPEHVREMRRALLNGNH